MDALGGALQQTVFYALEILKWIVIINAIMSWLVAFNVVNPRNQFVNVVWDTTNRLLAPILNPIRNILPNLGGIDISPIILLLLIFFLQNLVIRL